MASLAIAGGAMSNTVMAAWARAGVVLLVFLCASVMAQSTDVHTWTPDNGNGTFTNPLFYDEFSDPDMIRVGEDFYLTGTTMHSMPGLPVLHSKDLVNWEFLSYAADRLDLGPAFRLENGQNVYGQGFWAPSFRYHEGTFFIFSNVNKYTTQLFTAKDPRGPWAHHQMAKSFHDLSVLFDDDGKAYIIWGYRSIQMAQLNADLTDIVPGSQREIIPKEAGMGEGLHFYKFNGKYFITSAWYENRMRMPAARADHPEGPYEVNQAISADEDFGLAQGYRLSDMKGTTPPYDIKTGDVHRTGLLSLHQGGVIQTPHGEWWGFSMMDFNSVGRLTALSPVTWQDGWPYFGLLGNLGRTPRTWIKPKTASPQPIQTPYVRDDDFSTSTLNPIWQWNHVPVDASWSLSERKGYLRLHALPATSLWDARNTLTQRAIGPQSIPTTVLDTSRMSQGDVAGLALFNRPYAWLGVERTANGTDVVYFDEQTGREQRIALHASRIWLRAACDFMTEKSQFSFSTDGKTFVPIGNPFTMVFQLTTFQGVRYALFNFNRKGATGGVADFDAFSVLQPQPRGLMHPIPFGKNVLLNSFKSQLGFAVAESSLAVARPTALEIVDMGYGRVAFKAGQQFIAVDASRHVQLKQGSPDQSSAFQWIETPTGELILLSLGTNRYLRIDSQSHQILADSPGPLPDGSDGTRFTWTAAE
jgi:xylan 1,4-beta-xylosidase